MILITKQLLEKVRALRDEHELTFKQIATRLSIAESSAHKIYTVARKGKP